MNTLKLTCICDPTQSGIQDLEPTTFTQEIGDIPDSAISGIKTRINQINSALPTAYNNTDLSTATTAQKYAAAIKHAYGVKYFYENSGTITQANVVMNKIIGAELTVQETQNIYNYAQVGA